jgi:hypothetical protein
MSATKVMNALASFTVAIAAAVEAAAKSGLDSAEIAAALTKASELVEAADE